MDPIPRDRYTFPGSPLSSEQPRRPVNNNTAGGGSNTSMSGGVMSSGGPPREDELHATMGPSMRESAKSSPRTGVNANLDPTAMGPGNNINPANDNHLSAGSSRSFRSDDRNYTTNYRHARSHMSKPSYESEVADEEQQLYQAPPSHQSQQQKYAVQQTPATAQNQQQQQQQHYPSPQQRPQSQQPYQYQTPQAHHRQPSGDEYPMRRASVKRQSVSAQQQPYQTGQQNHQPSAQPQPSSQRQPPQQQQQQQQATQQKVHRGRQAIGDWKFMKTIGQGSMGQVKLAENQRNGALCAVKVVPRAGNSTKKDESKDIRTLREAAIGSLLHHSNVCKLYEIHAMPNHFYLLFEYVSGGQMLDYIIAHGSLKEKHARKFARSIASALDYCHRNSIVHRDLKIENILISEDGGIKIIDFGLSNLYNRRQLLKTFCGSLYFAAPELLSAKPYVGPEVDVWSFGIVLYVLVCGKVPFDDESMPALHEMIKQGKVEYPAWLSAECCDILSRMLVVDPLERASLQEIMNHPWMKRGYDGPPDNKMPRRTPLVGQLDPLVIDKIADFEIFGNREEINSQLHEILESPDYNRACQNWFAINERRGSAASISSRQSKHHRSLSSGNSHNDMMLNANNNFGGGAGGGANLDRRHSTHRHFSLDFGLRRHSYKPEIPDPTNAYHPLISMYYLVKEKMERQAARASSAAKAMAATTGVAGATARLEDMSINTVHNNTNGYPNPFGDRANGEHDEVINKPIKAVTRSKQHLQQQQYQQPQQQQLQQAAPLQSQPQPTQLGQPASRASVQYAETTPSYRHHQHHASEPMNRGLGTLLRRLSSRRKSTAAVPPSGYGATTPTTATYQPLAAGPTSYSASVASPGFYVSSPSSGQRHTRTSSYVPPQRSTSVSDSSRQPAEPVPDMPNMALSTRTRSWGHKKRQDSVSQQKQQSTEPLSIQYPKQVFLKGFFSVQTTSTKSLPYIRADIIRVLQQLNIPYREVKGGFACIYRASLNNEKPSTTGRGENGEENDNENDDYLAATTAEQARHHRRISFGSGIFRRRSVVEESSGASTESLDEATGIGGSDMLGLDRPSDDVRTPVRFKVYIVKIPLLGLHGVQFKKLTGNSWQYKNLATKVLGELKL